MTGDLTIAADASVTGYFSAGDAGFRHIQAVTVSTSSTITAQGAVSSPSFDGGAFAGTTGNFAGDVAGAGAAVFGANITSTTGAGNTGLALVQGALLCGDWPVCSATFRWTGDAWVPSTAVWSQLVDAGTLSTGTLTVLGVATVQGLLSSPILDGGAVIASTLNTAGPNVLGGSTLSGPITAQGTVSAPSLDGGAYAGTTLNLSGAAVVQGSVSSPSFDGGAYVGATLNLSQGAVISGTVSAQTLDGGSIRGTTLNLTGDARGAQNATFDWNMSASVLDGGAIRGTTLNLSGAAVVQGSISSPSFDGGAGVFTTLNLSGNAVGAGNATFSGTISGGVVDAGVLIVAGTSSLGGQLNGQDAGLNRISVRSPLTFSAFRLNIINATPQIYGGFYCEQACTIRNVHLQISNVAGAGTNNTMRISDGVSNCDAVFSCATLSTTGGKQVDTTGSCVFAAGSLLSIAETTSGCTPDPTIQTVTVTGWLQ